jgi:hypothetical protein
MGGAKLVDYPITSSGDYKISNRNIKINIKTASGVFIHGNNNSIRSETSNIRLDVSGNNNSIYGVSRISSISVHGGMNNVVHGSNGVESYYIFNQLFTKNIVSASIYKINFTKDILTIQNKLFDDINASLFDAKHFSITANDKAGYCDFLITNKYTHKSIFDLHLMGISVNGLMWGAGGTPSVLVISHK